MSKRPVARGLWSVSYLLLVVLISLVESRGLLSEGYPPGVGGDALGHLLKIWIVQEYLGRGDLPPPWVRWWGAGFPFLRFYPPLTYLLAGAAGLALGSPSWGYKFTVLVGFVSGPLIMERATRPLLKSTAASRAAGLIYGFSSWHLRMIAAEGNLPMFLGFSAAPFALLAAERVLEPGADWRSVAPSAAGLGVLILIHHTSALSAAVAFLPLMVTLLPRVIRDEGAMPTVRRAAVAAAVVLGVSSVWIVPVVVEADRARFLSARQFPGQLEFWSVKPWDIVTWPPRGYNFHLGLILLILPAAAAVAVRRREISTLVATGYLALVASFGSYGPFGWAFLFDPFSSIPPVRFLPTFVLCASIASVSWFPPEIPRPGGRGRSAVPLLLLLLLTSLSLAEAYPRTAELTSWSPPGDYLEAAREAASLIPSYARVYQPGLPSVEGSLPSLLPALARRPILGSWYAEATQIRWSFSLLEERVRFPSESDWVDETLDSYDVWAVLLSDRLPDGETVAETLREAECREAARVGEYSVWVRRGNPAEALRGRVLAVGRSAWVVGQVFPDASVDYGDSPRLDDYDPASLAGYDLVFLYGYDYGDPEMAREVLTSYLRGGGRVALSTFGGPDQDSPNVLGLGFRSRTTPLEGRPNLSGAPADILSPFSYEGGPWVGPLYSGDGIDAELTAEGGVLLGRLRYGDGEVYLIGENLLYHALYSENDEERRLLADFILPPPPDIGVTVLRWEDGRIDLRISSPRDAAVRVSEAWYPRWRAEVNGSRVDTWEDGQTNLLCLHIPPGVNEVSLRFEDLWRPLYPLSVASLAAAVLAALTLRGGGAPGGGGRRGRSDES